MYRENFETKIKYKPESLYCGGELFVERNILYVLGYIFDPADSTVQAYRT